MEILGQAGAFKILLSLDQYDFLRNDFANEGLTFGPKFARLLTNPICLAFLCVEISEGKCFTAGFNGETEVLLFLKGSCSN